MASAAANMLSLPFRRSNQISLSSTIRQYINSKYDQHPDMFLQDLEVIDALRRDAVNVREPHPTNVAKLQTYAGQLVWIGGKFPIDIGAEFSWYPALGYSTERPLVRNNLKFELMNILYNLASLYSQLAVNTPTSSTDGLKTAANYFSLAAGVLSHIKTAVLPELRMSDPPEDMDAETLESLTQLMLAQSQECFWQKAVMDGYKDASIAKLAARVSDLYNSGGEAAVKSDAISSMWIHHMSAKHHHFAAAAQYRAACDCLEKRKYGEEVARLKDAVACVAEGLKETKSGYLTKTVAEDLGFLKKKVEEDLKRAEKDNDMIYLNPVPPKSELKILDRANMAVARTPPQVSNPYDFFGDQAEFGPALFSRLVPFSVHVATTIYEGRRDQLVNRSIIPGLEALNEQMHSLLSSLDLPGSLQALEKPMGIPPSLQQHAEELRQADAVARVHKTFADIEKLRAADMAIFEEGKSMLLSEEEEDQRLRAKYGTDRWARPESRSDPEGSNLWVLVNQFETWFAQSVTSDGNVRKKFAAVEDVLEVLCGPTRGLTEFIPSSSSREMAEELKPVVGRLRSAYSDVLRLESRRRKKVEALRETARRDDIKPDILKEAARLERTYPNTALDAVHFEEFFDKRLDRLYEPEQEALDKEADDQEKLLSEVERVNKEFESQKQRLGNRGNRAREQALQVLDDAYFKYKETVNNLEEGRSFYNQLNQHVGQQFRDVVKGWVARRRMEARTLSEELDMPSLSNLNLAHNQAQPPPVANYGGQQPQQQQQHAGMQRPAVHSPAEASIQSWAGGGDAVQQPQPMQPPANPMGGVWNPSMGIKFGGGGGPAAGGTGAQAPGTWKPGSGIKFG